jgi:spermidine synthase
VVACFVLSGFAGLLYQTAWLRQLSIAFGTSELAVAAVLAAYMGGLALGAAVAGRVVGRVRRPVLWYGLLEAGVALSALAVPALLALADHLYGLALGGRPEPPDAAGLGQPLFYLGVGFAVLALPTGLMGATLPLLIRHAVQSDRELGPRVALLYASNTAGAVLGTLATGFLLLPALGLRRTVWVGVALNALVFAIAAALSRRAPPFAIASGDASGREPPVIDFFGACVAPLLARTAPLRDRVRGVCLAQPAWILPLILVSGAVAFVYEVLWTRLLSHVLGGSLYSFATMLAAFLSGIALGGGLAGRLAADRERAGLAFAASQLCVGFLSMAVYAWMGPLLPATQALSERVVYAIAVLLPATVFVGATFPLAVRVLARDERQAGGATARVYAWNTVGSIAGAILAAFWLIPEQGFEGAVRLAVCVNLALALWTLLCVVPVRPVPAGAVALALAGALLEYQPARPTAVTARTGFAIRELVAPRETFYAVGRTSTVMLLEQEGFHYLLTNGLPEAAIASRGSPPFPDPQQWLAALPVVARPDARSLLVIGLGGGVALEGVPPSVQAIDVVEIEPEVIRANRTLAGRRNRDPLIDPRVRLVVNDARSALRLTGKTYDAIVSQPSHPWTAGASHLFTREFVRSAREHLADGGVFVQWMNSEFVTAPLLRSLAATLLAEFAEVRLYQPGGQTLVFLASQAPLEVELALARSGRPLADDPAHYARLGILSVEDLAAALRMDSRGLARFAGGTPAGTDDDNPMATRSRSRADGLELAQLDELFAPFDALRDPADVVHAQLAGSLDFAYVARRILRLGQPSRAEALARAMGDEATRALVAAEVHAFAGRDGEARAAVKAALAADPANVQARFVRLRSLSAGDPQAEVEAVIRGLEGPAAAVVEGWQHAARGDWRALSSLDAELARSRATDVWFCESTRLRVLWRTQVAQGDSAERAREALRLLEPALVIAGDTDLFGLYQLRAHAAIAAGDADVLVESARDIVASIRGSLRQADASGQAPHPAQRALLRQSLDGLLSELARPLPGSAGERAQLVRGTATELIARIDAYAATGASE